MHEFAEGLTEVFHDVATISYCVVGIAGVVLGPFALIGFCVWLSRQK